MATSTGRPGPSPGLEEARDRFSRRATRGYSPTKFLDFSGSRTVEEATSMEILDSAAPPEMNTPVYLLLCQLGGRVTRFVQVSVTFSFKKFLN